MGDEERMDALSRNKATSSEIGVQGRNAALEFATEAFNYNTMSDEDPRNLILLCTKQGIAVQADGRGSKRLYHHDIKKDGTISRHWLEAEESKHKVGGEQKESDEERMDALSRNKDECSFGAPAFKSKRHRLPSISFKTKRKGKSSAARVSKGSFVDEWDGLTIQEPKRHPNEHCTATIVMYYTCNGGVPTDEDIIAAIDDIEELYRGIEGNGQLSDNQFDFMKSELTVKDVIDISKKIINH